MIRIVSIDGRTPEQAMSDLLRRAISSIKLNNKQVLADPIANTTKGHIWAKYPGSQHWNPSKVVPKSGDGYEGIVDVDIEGAGRAYHAVDIYPVRAQSLAIPLHRAAYGLSPKDVQGLFRPKGTNVLAIQNGKLGLTFMYALSKHVHQNQDSSLMPTDERYFERLSQSVAEFIDKHIAT